jgi:hypothetical protein
MTFEKAARGFDPVGLENAIAVDELNVATVRPLPDQLFEPGAPSSAGGHQLALVERNDHCPIGPRPFDAAVVGGGIDVDDALADRARSDERANEAIAFVSADQDDADIFYVER